MADPCVQPYSAGKVVAVEYNLSCGDENPELLSYSAIGAMRGKSLTLGADVEDTTTDSTVGDFRSSGVLFKNMSFSGDGLSRPDDGLRHNRTALLKHWFNTSQPAAWFRFTYPDVTIYAYMNITDFSLDSPNDAWNTFSIELEVTASDYGVVMVDTPTVVDSLEVSPEELTVSIGGQANLYATTSPVGSNVTWESDTPAVATVSPSGLVTGLTEGTAIITGTAGTETDMVTVTVTA